MARLGSVTGRSVAIAALVLGVVAPPSHAATGSDARAKQAQVRQQRATVAGQLNVLKATDSQVAAALDALAEDVDGQTADAAEASRAAADAARAAADAVAAEQAQQAQLDQTQATLRSLALAAYTNPPDTGVLAGLDPSSTDASSLRWALSQLQSSQIADALDAMAQARDDLAVQRQAAEQAQRDAEARKQDEAAQLESLRKAKARQESKAAEIDDRIDRLLSESAQLASIDKALSDQIAKEQAALAARLRRVNANRGGSGGGGAAGPTVGRSQVTSVRGIEVNVSIADNLRNLLAAADADGISLSGSGYRDPSGQIAVRRNNCGSSNYAIYQMPASSCRPPTARPGSSMHERGLAIDFTYNGSVIGSRSSPGYKWLAAHAGRYGFYNLPSEPWHWSTNGN